MSAKRTLEWRLSGQNLMRHAFASHDGYVPPRKVIATIEYSPDSDLVVTEAFGPYEGFVAECGHIIPMAMNLPPETGDVCPVCLHMTELRRTAPAPPGSAGRRLLP